MGYIVWRLLPLVGVLYLLSLTIQLLPYILVGLLVWVGVETYRVHRRRKRAEAFQQAEHQHQWRT